MTQIGLNSNRILNFKSTQANQAQQYQQMTLEQNQPEITLPKIYQISSPKENEGFKETIKKWDMMGLVYPWLEHPLLMLGTCFGLGWGVDKFSKACGGEYEKSLVGKTAKLGDNIQESKLVQSKPFQTVWGWGETAKNKICKTFKNSDVFNAILKTPSQPELRFVADELLTMEQRVVHDFSNVTRTLKLNTPEVAKLTDLGLDKSEKEFINNFFKGIATTEEKASNAIQLKRIGLKDDAIRDIIDKPDALALTKKKQLEKLGITAEFLEKLEKNPATKEDIAKVREACSKARGMKIGAGHQKFLGPVQPFERTIGLDEIGNRLTSMTKAESGVISGAKTKTGKLLATFLQKCHRGFTFGGGKMGVLFFVSPIIVDTILDVKKAENNEKLGTLAHGLVHAGSWVFTFPLALEIMHRFGGMQYAGMSKEAVEESRNLIKEFNEKTNPYKECSFIEKIFGGGIKKPASETFQSYDEYKIAKEELAKKLKELRKTKDQNLLTKMCKGIGKFLTMDLEITRSYKGAGSLNIRNIGKKLSNVLRNVGGVPLRLAIWGGLTMGVLDGLINKGIKGCFGNFYDRYKEEEFESAKKEQKKFLKEDLQARLLDAQKRKIMGIETQNIAPTTIETPKNLEKAIVEENTINNPKNELKTETNNQIENLEEKQTKNLSENTTKSDNLNKLAETPSEVTDMSTGDKNTNELLNIRKPIDTNTYIPDQAGIKIKPKETVKRDNYTYIPSSENVLKKQNNNTDVNKYIPSQLGAKFNKTFDNSGLEAVLKRADRAEAKAIQTLAGNFGNY